MPEECAHYGALAEFDSPQALLDAARRARGDGYRALDAFTPFPVDGLADILEMRDSRVLWLGLIGGIFGAFVGFGIQVYVNFDYSLNVGGRPQYSLTAFLMVGLWITILCAALFPGIGMLALNGLPRLHHPVFADRRFHLASRDRFFLCVKAEDERFDQSRTPRFLQSLGALSVEMVPR